MRAIGIMRITVTTTTGTGKFHTMFSRARPNRISCFAVLATTTCAALSQREPHADHQSHEFKQEIWGMLTGPLFLLALTEYFQVAVYLLGF
jgi:hypothetical protein